MSRFVQIHMLTHYPASNPNRDDLGRPKTAKIGDAERQRISSQSLKRAIRESEAFASALTGKIGDRTQRLGEVIHKHLVSRQVDDEQATKIARDVAGVFGKIKGEKDENPLLIEQLAFISPDEKALALKLADKLVEGEELPKEKELAKTLLQHADGAVDIAMFGRMLANNPDYNRDAAVQIAHAITTNQVTIEDDYYTAVDDLKKSETDAGAGFVGEAGFGSGVYYVYANVNTALLLKNLDGDAGLAAKGLGALVHALATATPGGKQNSFAHHVRPEYILVECGDGQPLNLFSAFDTPVKGPGLMQESIDRLRGKREQFAKSYGKTWERDMEMQVGSSDSTTLGQLAEFAAASLGESRR